MRSRRLIKVYVKLLKKIRFANLALRQKLIFVHILLLVIPLLLLYYYVIGIYIDDKKSEVLSSISQVGQIAMSNIDNYVQQVQELTKQPLYDQYVISSLIDNNSGTGGGFVEDDTNSASRLVNRIMAFNPYIHSVFLVNLRGGYIYRIVDNSLVKPYNPANEKWYAGCLKMDGKPVMVSSYSLNDYMEQRGGRFFVFAVARAVKNTASTQLLGAIIINVNVSYLESVCSNVESVKGERILILDKAGGIVFDSDKSNIGKQVGSPEFDFNAVGKLDLDKKYNSLEYGKNRYLAVVTESAISGWRLIRVIPENSLYSDVWMIRNRLSIFLAVFVAFSMLLSVFISYGVTKPLNKLMHTMKDIERGDLSLRFKVRYKDEVGQLGRSFNKMINKIDNLVNIVYVSRLRKREAELQALQAQINPHFIYNTMEAIRMTAKVNGDNETSEMALILGKLLRYSINIKNKIVTVAEEIEHLKNYLVIQNYRFDNKFDLYVNVERELYEVKIIKLIFQPVVENSIYHGLKTSSNKGVITLTGFRQDGGIIFNIEDNGMGISGEELTELNRKVNDFQAAATGNGGIGLKNINERITLHYGEGYGITILSEPGVGTAVRIKLPGGQEAC